MPRTTQHTIYKSTPQLAEERFYPLSQTTDECSRFLPKLSTIFGREEQQLSLISHYFSQRRADVSQVTQQHSTINTKCQRRSGITVMEVGRQQHAAANVPVQVAQQMQLETKEPAGGAFAPVRTIFSEEPHAPVTP
jgi:hypothetical protein